MTPTDYYANEGYDQAGELLCTAPEHPQPCAPFAPATFAQLPAVSLSDTMVEIARWAASARTPINSAAGASAIRDESAKPLPKK